MKQANESPSRKVDVSIGGSDKILVLTQDEIWAVNVSMRWLLHNRFPNDEPFNPLVAGLFSTAHEKINHILSAIEEEFNDGLPF